MENIYVSVYSGNSLDGQRGRLKMRKGKKEWAKKKETE
jgi:hypothetical protein